MSTLRPARFSQLVLVLACAILSARVGLGQEMPGKGMTCWDTRELCDLNCVFATTHSGPTTLDECNESCVSAQEACTDSDETVAYVSCATDCATSYDVALTKCNQQTSNLTKGTYGANLDACANIASGIMDDCMEECYGTDRFSGWTPDKEEGMHVASLEDEIWRHPFRSKSTIYGRLRGEQSS